MCKTVGTDSQLQMEFTQMPCRHWKELCFTLACCSLLTVGIKTKFLFYFVLFFVCHWELAMGKVAHWRLGTACRDGAAQTHSFSLDLGMETFYLGQPLRHPLGFEYYF